MSGGPRSTAPLTRSLLATSESRFVLAHGLLATVALAVAGGEALPRLVAVGISLTMAALYALTAKGLNTFHRDIRFAPVPVAVRLALSAILPTAATTCVLGPAAAAAFATAVLAGAIAHRLACAYLKRFPRRFLLLDPDSIAGRDLQLLEGRSFYRRESIEALLRRDPALEVVVPHEPRLSPTTVRLVRTAVRNGALLRDEVSFYAEVFGRLPLDGTDQDCRFGVDLARGSTLGELMTRIGDALVAMIGLVLFSPLLAIIAIAVKLQCPGPIFHTALRQGRFKRPFPMVKFRTMTHERRDPTAPFSLARDPRVTPVGRLLRHFHLDELPQLWNVLRGEMSIVGPRPDVLEIAEALGQEVPAYDLRYLVRPGLTGLAQIEQGYALADASSTLRKLSYDLHSLRKRSVGQWLAVVLRTAFFMWNDGHYRNLIHRPETLALPASLPGNVPAEAPAYSVGAGVSSVRNRLR